MTTSDAGSRRTPATLVRDVSVHAPYSVATRDHSRIIIRANPDAAKDRGEIRLLFGWAAGLKGLAR